MNNKLKFISVAFALSMGLTTVLMKPSFADSTADLLFIFQCGEYEIEIWQSRFFNTYLYRSQSPKGNLSLDDGLVQNQEGIFVYKFINRNYQYWVWDATLDNPNTGVLEVYYRNRQILQRTCHKQF